MVSVHFYLLFLYIFCCVFCLYCGASLFFVGLGFPATTYCYYTDASTVDWQPKCTHLHNRFSLYNDCVGHVLLSVALLSVEHTSSVHYTLLYSTQCTPLLYTSQRASPLYITQR